MHNSTNTLAELVKFYTNLKYSVCALLFNSTHSQYFESTLSKQVVWF